MTAVSTVLAGALVVYPEGGGRMCCITVRDLKVHLSDMTAVYTALEGALCTVLCGKSVQVSLYTTNWAIYTAVISSN